MGTRDESQRPSHCTGMVGKTEEKYLEGTQIVVEKDSGRMGDVR